MRFIEKNLEDIIFNHFEEMQDRGLDLRIYHNSYTSLQRQVQLGSCGIADLILFEIYRLPHGQKYIIITIIECKKGVIDLNAYLQVKRYKEAIKSIIQRFDVSKKEIYIRTVLIGSELPTNSDFAYVLKDDSDNSCFSYTYELDGISFKNAYLEYHAPAHSFPIKNITKSFKSIYSAFCDTEQKELDMVDKWAHLD